MLITYLMPSAAVVKIHAHDLYQVVLPHLRDRERVKVIF